MPTIAGPKSSPYKEMVAVRSEKAGYSLRSNGGSAPQKRKLISDSPAAQDCSISTPMKLKSPRKSSASSAATPERVTSDALEEQLGNARKSTVKKLSDHQDIKSSWNFSEQLSMVKEALHVSKSPSIVLCRETEQGKILEFLTACIEKQKAGSLYICGCPGTGKSLSMVRVKQQVVDWTKEENLQAPNILNLNCTSLITTSEIFSKILGNERTRKKLNASMSPLQHLQNLYSQKHHSSGSKMTLLIADELDYLITKDQSVLHELFMLTTLPYSRCILIGIANAIDLADRFLPRLKSLNCKPAVVTFPAYSKDQILRILEERLAALPYVFQPKALELCARKVAAASGDMRRALCVCRSAVELLEAELRESANDSNSVPEDELFSQDATTALMGYLVKVDHVAATLAKTFKSPIVDIIQSLPHHQQIILCSAVKSFRGCKRDTTVGELNKTYVDICKATMMPPVGTMEFTSMCRVLNDQGLLKLGQGREDRLRRVALKVDESDIMFALQGIRFFRNCLQ